MPMPWTYRDAAKEWQAFPADAQHRMGLSAGNRTYKAMDGAVQVVPRRLTAQQDLDFAGVLPSVLRAVFVKVCDVSATPVPFPNRGTLKREMQAVRPDHTLTFENSSEARGLALALRPLYAEPRV